jgi:hypothetical protein
VKAVGGELELTVTLPKRPVLRIHHLGKTSSNTVAKMPADQKVDRSSPRQRHGRAAKIDLRRPIPSGFSYPERHSLSGLVRPPNQSARNARSGKLQ